MNATNRLGKFIPPRLAGLMRKARERPALFILSTAVFMLVAVTALWYHLLASSLPDIADVNAVAKRQTTVVYASDGGRLSMLYRQNRTLVPLSKISPALKTAAIAIEDERFYRHKGIDYIGIARAAARDILSREALEGGSTITQQYVKNAYFTPERTLTRKLKEAILSYRLEKSCSKSEILEKYLNTIYLGDGAYGVEVASRTYFDKPASELNLAESALIAGLIQAPEVYNPHRNADAALRRRNVVLDKMRSLGLASKREVEWAKTLPLGVVSSKAPADEAPYFVEWIKAALAKRFGGSALYSGGLRIYTTLDPKLQRLAEKAAYAQLNTEGDPEVALVAVETSSGAVKAMVGGRDFGKRKFNLASQARRQPGSAFKPFTLATAISEGVSPDALHDASSPASLEMDGGRVWKVNNYSGSGADKMDLWRATAVSSNVVFARLIVQLGAEKVAKLARAAGITTPLNEDPAIALGGLEEGVSPLEMAASYATFGNAGRRNEPYGVTKVTTADGRLLFEWKPKAERTIDEAVAYLVTKALRNVINWGTGTGAYIDRPAAGKTGTTDEYTDAWFVGYTPELSTAVWMGYPNDMKKKMSNVHGIAVTGGSFPATVWSDFMTSALEGKETKRFPDPPPGSLATLDICRETGKLAGEYCPETKAGTFLKKYRPTGRCSVHPGVDVPDLADKVLSEAVAILKEQGFECAIEKKVSSSPVDRVISQTPAGGTRARKGVKVTLVVSAGRVSVPSLVGLTEVEALATLQAAGLKAIREYVNSSKPPGTIVGQSPAAGESVAVNGEVVITIAKTDTTSGAVPDVSGRSLADARRMLEEAGYVVIVEMVTDPTEIERSGFDVVVTQKPGPGTVSPPGTSVTIRVTPSG